MAGTGVGAYDRGTTAPDGRTPLSPFLPEAPGGLRLLAGLVFAAAVLTSLAHFAGLSTIVSPDTGSYLVTLRELFSRHPGDPAIRTPFYPALLAAADALGHAGFAVIALQILGRACACAYLALVLARVSRGAGALVGILLAVETASATNSVTYLTESLFTSGQVLCLALLVHQAAQAAWLRRRDLLIAGALLGAALMIRPTGWVFLPPLLLAYAWVLGSLRRALPFAVGFFAVILGIVLFNGIRTGYYGVARSGIYLAFPLLTQNLFHPENGPVSREFAEIIHECRPDLDLAACSVEKVNACVHGAIAPCLTARFGGDPEAPSRMLRDTYVEALRARPLEFAARMAEETLLFLYWTAPHHALQSADFGLVPATNAYCATPSLKPAEAALRSFVCPRPQPSLVIRKALIGFSFALRPLYQPHAVVRQFAAGTLPRAALVLLGYWALALLVAPPALRLPIVLAVAFLVTNAAATAAGQVTIARYVSVAAPFHLVVSGTAAAALASRGRAALARLLPPSRTTSIPPP